MVKSGFVRSAYDNCVNHKWLSSKVGIFLLLYVDDMLIASVDRTKILKLKEQLVHEFEMKHLGKARKILGMSIKMNEELGELKVSEGRHLQQVLSKFGMNESKPA